MTLKTVLIDDEKNNLDNLFALLQQHCPVVEVVAAAGSAEEGRDAISRLNPDLVFLDIQMPGKNGFDLLRSLPRYNFDVIFVTAYDKYGIQAVKFAAVDYLLKPVNAEELQEAVTRVIEKNRRKKENLQLENLLQILQKQHNRDEHRIALTTLKETRFIYTRDIVHCESSNNYTTFFVNNGEKLLVSRPIHEYEDMLGDYGFIRCHQSYLVNKKYIKSWVKEDGGYLLLYNNTQIPVSRNKKDAVTGALKSGN